MIQFAILDKAQKDEWIPVLWRLYYENMSKIAPSGLPYEEERAQWFSAVAPALEKVPRKIILCTNETGLLGYLQYYTRGNLLMIEEVQVMGAYHRTTLFYRMCKYLAQTISPDIQYVEAYAHKQNTNSQRIMGKLGMVSVDDGEESEFLHLRGDADKVRKCFL